jgi:transcriptional regulator with XRE-family HTH domain
MVRKTAASDSFGRGLRQLRTRAGMSQEELAHEADISLRYIGQIERGYQRPTSDVILALAAALGVEGEDLMRAARELGDLG